MAHRRSSSAGYKIDMRNDPSSNSFRSYERRQSWHENSPSSHYIHLRPTKVFFSFAILTCLVFLSYFFYSERLLLPIGNRSADSNDVALNTSASSRSSGGPRIYTVTREDIAKLPADYPDDALSIETAPADLSDEVSEDDNEFEEDQDFVPSVESIPELPKALKDPLPKPVSPLGIGRPAAEVDAQVCPHLHGKPCKFLVPALVGEQESKAQMHLYQLGLVAAALNRTLVLPNLSRSRLGTCFKHPFDFYYDYKSFDRLGIPAVSLSNFLDWSAARDTLPHGQHVTLTSTNTTFPRGAVRVKSTASVDGETPKPSPEDNFCLSEGLDFSSWSPIEIFPPLHWSVSQAGRYSFGKSLVDTLKSGKVDDRSNRLDPDDSPDALVFNYELRFEILSPNILRSLSPQNPPQVAPYSHFKYAPSLTSLARVIADTFGPFIAVHWRQETLPSDIIGPCAEALTDNLAQLVQKHSYLKTVYLATDYPIEAIDESLDKSPKVLSDELAENNRTILAHSGTFSHSLTQGHHQAMQRFLQSFKGDQETGSPKVNLELLTFDRLVSSGRLQQSLPPSLAAAFPEELGGIDLGSIDAGLLGIVDKQVAVRANILVIGDSESTKKCAKRSSFTRQIISERHLRPSDRPAHFTVAPEIWRLSPE